MIDVRKVTNDIVLTLASEAGAIYGITVQEVFADTRNTVGVQARKHVYKRLWDAGWSKSKIARTFGKDHSTICHALGTHPEPPREPKPEKPVKVKKEPPPVITPDDVFGALIGAATYPNVRVLPSKRIWSYCYGV